MEKVRFGIIGVGNIGTAHAKKLIGGMVENGVLSAACDLKPERLERIKNLEGCPEIATFTDYKEMLASGTCDAVIVATHMMLAAHSIGVGSCWVMHFDPVAMREAFSIPREIEPLALLVLGYPSEDAAPLPLHEKTRPLSEVVYYDHF